MSISKKLMTTGAEGDTYIDDVFSTYLYEGTGADQDIENGINLASKGGLVWIKNRERSNPGQRHWLVDTERGVNNGLDTSDTIGEVNLASVNAFNSNGFSVTDANDIWNGSTYSHVSWTFRKAPKFFDVVTYTGDGTSSRQISHGLDTGVGMTIVKCSSHAQYWHVWHEGISPSKALYLNRGDAEQSAPSAWNSTYPTSTHFTVGASLNTLNQEYVAYLFANDSSDESMIKCGSYTGTGVAGLEIDLGWEPQWVLIKSAGSSQEWFIVDSMRGGVTGGDDKYLQADTNSAEGAYDILEFTSTGFNIINTTGWTNSFGTKYIYTAIRRPNKPAEEFEPEELFTTPSYYTAGDPVFQLINADPSNPIDFPVDMAITRHGGAPDSTELSSRLTQGKRLYTNTGDPEATDSNMMFDYSNGYHAGVSGTEANMVGHGFRRASGFFDVMCYTGNGNARYENHNLGVVPEMIWLKGRTSGGYWPVFHKDIKGNMVFLNAHDAKFADQTYFGSSATTMSSTLWYHSNNSNVCQSGQDFIAYLFATVDGISKVGSYTADGSEQTIDCGFTNGARFVLVRRTDANGNWWYSYGSYVGSAYVNTRMYAFNQEETDYVTQGLKVSAEGFTIQAGNSNTNASGGEYIFYAIA